MKYIKINSRAYKKEMHVPMFNFNFNNRLSVLNNFMLYSTNSNA